MLLSYISAGKDGNQALLNLRKVCSTTKSWIDELSPSQKRRFSPNLQVSIFLCRKNIADFLLSPPPYKVTSLKLANTIYLCSYSSRNGHSVEETQLIKSFVAFWCPKLEYLEIERVTKEVVDYFGPSTTLKRIRCTYISDDLAKLEGLESLSIRNTNTYGDRVSFCVQMAARENLKNLEIRWQTQDLKGLTTLINTKRRDTVFTLTAWVCIKRNRNGNPLNVVEIWPDADLDTLKQFVFAVANSSSSICLTRLADSALSTIVEVTEDDDDKTTLNNFFSKVGWTEFLYVKDLGFIMDLVKGNKFPNLERFDENRIYVPREQVVDAEETRDLVQFPGKLQFLTICSRELWQQTILPQSLKYLSFAVTDLTLDELQDAICSLSDSCPFLEEISVSWKCTLPITINDVSSKLKNKEIFPTKVALLV